MDQATEPDTPVEAWKLLPNNTHQSWVKDRGLRRLNLGIALMFASSAGTGYNGSLINGLLVLPQCKESTIRESLHGINAKKCLLIQFPPL